MLGMPSTEFFTIGVKLSDTVYGLAPFMDTLLFIEANQRTSGGSGGDAIMENMENMEKSAILTWTFGPEYGLVMLNQLGD